MNHSGGHTPAFGHLNNMVAHPPVRFRTKVDNVDSAPRLKPVEALPPLDLSYTSLVGASRQLIPSSASTPARVLPSPISEAPSSVQVGYISFLKV